MVPVISTYVLVPHVEQPDSNVTETPVLRTKLFKGLVPRRDILNPGIGVESR